MFYINDENEILSKVLQSVVMYLLIDNDLPYVRPNVIGNIDGDPVHEWTFGYKKISITIKENSIKIRYVVFVDEYPSTDILNIENSEQIVSIFRWLYT